MNYKPPKGVQRFQAGMVLIVSVLLVGGVWTGGWFVAQAMVNSAINDWIDAARADGATVSYESLDLSGYPARIVLKIKAPVYRGVAFGEAIEWQGESLTVMTRPWNPWALNIQAPGKHTVNLAAKSLSFKGEVAGLNVDLNPGEGWPDNLDVSVVGLKLKEQQTASQLSMGKFKLHISHDPNGAGLKFFTDGTAIRLPKVLKLPLGQTVQVLALTFTIADPLSPAELAGDLSQILPRWQKRGNQINITRFKLRNGPLGLTTSGTLALDDNLQPTGTFTAKFEGLFKVLEILRMQGQIDPSNAVIATMALSAFSKRPPGGGPSTINLSVKVKDQKLSLGPIKIFDIPRVTWGIAEPKAEVEDVPVPRNYKDIAPVY